MWLRGLLLIPVLALLLNLSSHAQDPASSADGNAATKGTFSQQLDGALDNVNHALESKDKSDMNKLLLIFAFAGIAMAIKTRSRHRRNQTRLEIIKVLAEKNQPIPPHLLEVSSPASFGSRNMNERKAVGCMAVGAGLSLYFFYVDPASGLWAIGLALLLFGAGHLWLKSKNRSSAE
jgi:hypothetical protein